MYIYTYIHTYIHTYTYLYTHGYAQLSVQQWVVITLSYVYIYAYLMFCSLHGADSVAPMLPQDFGKLKVCTGSPKPYTALKPATLNHRYTPNIEV